MNATTKNTERDFPPPTIDLLVRGMDCLIEGIGLVEAEAFIAAVKREQFDYTKWHQEKFANGMTVEDIVKNAVAAQ